MQTYPTIRRRSNGTIDIEAYRRDALAERAKCLTQFMKHLGRAGRSLVLAVGAVVTPAAKSPSGGDWVIGKISVTSQMHWAVRHLEHRRTQ